jgi:hypothetical protein
MSKFIKSEFTPGEYATYGGKFVARFKRGGRGSFLTFLCKNFTVEEYFSRLDAGEPPLKILESKGYVNPRVQKLLNSIGLPPTLKGKEQYIMSQIRQAL